MKKSFVFALILALGLMETSAALVSDWHEPYESYFLYLGEYPANANPGWHEDVQGVTHDTTHWFITQANDDNPSEQALWKIPVGHDLASVDPNDVGVTRLLISDVQELAQEGYWHFGDLSYCNFDGKGYLVIPVEFGCHAIAIFRADDLSFVDYFQICAMQASASWCAVDLEGYLYSSDYYDVSIIKKYEANWAEVKTGGSLNLKNVDNITLLDENGSPLTLQHVQGGVISPSGRLLYVVADGIHVFDTQSWRRVRQSTNGKMPFNYEFHPSFPKYEEPEGITIWDLDDGRAPGLGGQLHVFMLDNDWPDDDNVYFKHYTGTIYVEGTYSGEEENGRPWDPYNTVTEANNLAWDGARIAIKAGSYPESLTFSKRIQLVAYGGTATIGTGGRISLSASATINISKSGILKIY